MTTGAQSNSQTLSTARSAATPADRKAWRPSRNAAVARSWRRASRWLVALSQSGRATDRIELRGSGLQWRLTGGGVIGGQFDPAFAGREQRRAELAGDMGSRPSDVPQTAPLRPALAVSSSRRVSVGDSRLGSLVGFSRPPGLRASKCLRLDMSAPAVGESALANHLLRRGIVKADCCRSNGNGCRGN
jgi:hypothetical protein